LVEHVKRGPIGIHCTYLKDDGTGKADVERAKVMYGPVGGGAVRFGTPVAGEELAINAEKIFSSEGRSVRIAMPSISDSDFNSVLIGDIS
jgi:hypothetical protein